MVKKEADKKYIVEKDISGELSPEEKKRLKEKKTVPEDKKGRQDIFVDRRDPLKKGTYKGKERRISTHDRRND